MSAPLRPRTYWIVFGWLVVFTVIEVALAGLPLPPRALWALLVGTALGKAALIALYFMHLKFEGPLVWLLPGIPLFFALFFACGLLPDVAWGLTWRA